MIVSAMTQNQVDLGKQLLEACRLGNTEEVKSLMQSGAAFTTDWMGTSPLHFAAQFGHVEVLDVLLKAGVSRDTRTKVDRTPLHLAAQEGHLDIVTQLVNAGADLDAKDLLKMTPLHWAVERGYFDIAECLLLNGSDPNAVNKFDKTPIDIAYDVGYIDMVPILQVSLNNYINFNNSLLLTINVFLKQKYTQASPIKPRKESKLTPSPANSKSRPIILPNKAIRTPKIVQKPVVTGQVATSSSSNSLPSIKTVRLADSNAVKTMTTSFTNSPNIQKVIVPAKGNISYDAIKRLVSDINNPEALSKIIIKTSNSNNNNNCLSDEHPLLSGKPVVINTRSLELESCKKELEETKTKMQEFKNLVDKLKSQLNEKEKNITELVNKNSDITAKYNSISEENEELKRKLKETTTKATSTTSSTSTSSASASTPASTTLRKETRSITNQQSQVNNINTSSIKTRGVRVHVLKHKS